MYGRWYERTTTAAVKLINEGGGIAGRPVEIVAEDDGTDPKRGSEVVEKLARQHKVDFVYGTLFSHVVIGSAPRAGELKIPYFVVSEGYHVASGKLNRYVFHVRASYYDETEKIVEQVVSTGGKKISVFFQNDAYGEAGRKGTEMALTKRGLKIHSNGTVERNTLKVEEAVKGIHSSEPDAIVMVGAYAACAEFIRQMRKSGSGATFYNVSFVGSKALADALGSEGSGVAMADRSKGP